MSLPTPPHPTAPVALARARGGGGRAESLQPPEGLISALSLEGRSPAGTASAPRPPLSLGRDLGLYLVGAQETALFKEQ